MARGNGKSEAEPTQLEVERELPAADGPEDPPSVAATASASVEGSELQKLRTERDTLLDRLARVQADFENARKRAARDQQEFREYALADALKALLPVLDSLDRALQAGSAEKSELRNGVELINKQLHEALGKLGLRTIPAKGEPFDPRWHEAIEMVDTTEAEDHQVIDELQRGYKLKGRLLRPAMVRVARNPKH
ncbi:MAG: nucleotide exchange factor GrpE [Terriglobales bacterium]